jgi:hypothetical protein
MWRGMVEGNLPGGLPGSKGKGGKSARHESRAKDMRRARACNLANIAQGRRFHER